MVVGSELHKEQTASIFTWPIRLSTEHRIGTKKIHISGVRDNELKAFGQKFVNLIVNEPQHKTIAT